MTGKVLYVVSRPLQINTSASIRNRATIMGLVENGYQVSLVTTKPDKSHMAFDPSVDLNDVMCHYIELGGIQSVAKVVRKFKVLKPLYRIAIRLFGKYSIYDNLISIIDHTSDINIDENYDYIISSSDPKSSHLFVEKLLKENTSFRGKWIQIWGDPFYDDITLPASVDKNEVYKEEERLISGADKVVYVSKLTLQKQQDRYSKYASKMECHPIPYNREIITINQPLNEKEYITLAYCGDYSSKIRNIKPLYEAVKEMEHIKMVICGGTDLHLLKSERISILPRQSYDIVENIEAESDILVHISNLHGGQIPGKLYQYSGTNKPILFILDGDKESLKQEFSKYGRYVFSENNKESIKQSLTEILNSSIRYHPVAEFSKKEFANQIVHF